MNGFFKKWILLLMLVSCKFFSSCTVDFVPDPVNPDLTVYSADGKNIASAFINGHAWNSFSSCGSFYWCNRISVINQINNKRIFISIHPGKMVISDTRLSIEFTLENTEVNSLGEIMKLDNLRLPLDGQPNYASLSTVNSTSHEGQLFIREIINTDSDNYIMAGTFGFIITDDDGTTYEVFKGRFDSYIEYYEED